MTWLIQFLIVWFTCPQNVNLLFVLVCLWAALGACPRQVALASVVLYLLLAMV